MSPLLSVVVPFHNVAPYFEACLASLAEQELGDAEFVLVDDGSTDDGPLIAQVRADKDPRFTVVTQRRRGLSAARNAGTAVTTGRYLAFADADDVVPATAYRSLVNCLERSGSDFASGDVRRLTSAGVHRHPRYTDVFDTPRTRTHITRDHRLILDRMIWNKVFRRSFWDDHGFAFSLAEYEDAPVTVTAHILAEAVDVLAEVVYHWRIRDTGEPSITQRLHEPANLEARMRMMVETGRIVRRLAPDLLDAYERDMCMGDLRVAITSLRWNSDQALAAALGLGVGFLAGVDPRILAVLPERDRLHLDLLARGRTDELRKVLRAEQK
ncbi:glycosyltransferase [Kitasatospora sp. NBC_00240]|uniref:glycosyltransferase n=1 Tax=Kitasatospora sp. NBC_00240 TaxID=2903567 RepID=UPI00225A14CD|nr:glycosyltransferase [Kitasatospora sp. NBC_00240]MCX5208702.1 glycosyltransferase [Kitasatospora sp. NBC_00240]